MIGWFLHNGVGLAGVVGAWLMVAGTGVGTGMALANWWSDLLSHMLDCRLQRRRWWMAHELAEMGHQALVESLKVSGLPRAPGELGTGEHPLSKLYAEVVEERARLAAKEPW